MKKNDNYYFVYCLAGKGSRFIDEGIFVPKFLLELNNNRTILETSINQFNFENNVVLVVVLNYSHKLFENQISNLLISTGLRYIIKFVEDTNGQAETAKIAIEDLNTNYPIFFFNGDTILKNRDLNYFLEILAKGFKGVIDVFNSNSSNFSYVKVNGDIVIEIKEKKPISNFATSGLYGFSSVHLYLQFFKELQINSEIFISDVYDKMLSKKLKITIVKNLNSDTIILGTPLEFFKNKKLIQ